MPLKICYLVSQVPREKSKKNEISKLVILKNHQRMFSTYEIKKHKLKENEELRLILVGHDTAQNDVFSTFLSM